MPRNLGDGITTSRSVKFRTQWKNYFEYILSRKGINKAHLAELCGLSASTISNISKHGLIPTMDALEKISKVLGYRDQLMLAAGYIPHTYKLSKLFEILELEEG